MKKNISIIGTGISGCSLAHFLAHSGWHVTLFEAEDQIAQGGSGNPVAMIYPKFMVNDEAYNSFMLKSFTFTTTWLKKLGLNKNDFKLNGAIEILDKNYAARLAVNLKSKNLYKDKIFSEISESLLINNTLDHKKNGFFFPNGGWVNPRALCHHLTNDPHIQILTQQKIITIKQIDNEWILINNKNEIFKTDHVVLCNAGNLHQFSMTQHLVTDIFRGQINWVNQTKFSMPSMVSCDEGYLTPLIQGKHIFGSTYAMNDLNHHLRVSDTRKNIASMKALHHKFYEHCLTINSIEGRVSWRASTKDRKPLVGRVFDEEIFKKMRVRELANKAPLPWLHNFYVASAFGSRGFTFAPYCAYLLTRLMNNNLSRDDKVSLNYTNPERYRLRKMSLKKIANHIFEV